jgi:hypothetical protein
MKCYEYGIRNTLFLLKFENWPNKLEFYISIGWKGLLGTNTLAYLSSF